MVALVILVALVTQDQEVILAHKVTLVVLVIQDHSASLVVKDIVEAEDIPEVKVTRVA